MVTKAQPNNALLERMEYRALMLAKRAFQRLRPRRPTQAVFIGGMQRSGTNMIMDRLERSFLTDVFHERDPRAFDDYLMRPLPVIHRLFEGSPAPTFVIKALCELDQLTHLMAEFAPAKTVWIVRDYRDAVRSALVSFSDFKEHVRAIAADRSVDDWRAHGMSEETHRLVQRLWHPEMSEPTASALIWYFRNVLFFEQGFDRDPRVHLLAYETLVLNPEAECKSMFDFLNLPFSPWITRGVFSSSVRHQPPQDLDPEVGALCEGLLGRFAECRQRPLAPPSAASS